MRVRICRPPSELVAGILGDFKPGETYDVGRRGARRFAEIGWAEYLPPHDCSTEDVRPPNNSGALILVVDDDIDMRQLTTTLLMASGYDVVEASEGRKA